MQKTRKSMVKRFKVTGTGKIMRRTPGRRHLMTAKSSHQIRSSRADKPVYVGFHKAIRASMPGAF